MVRLFNTSNWLEMLVEMPVKHKWIFLLVCFGFLHAKTTHSHSILIGSNYNILRQLAFLLTFLTFYCFKLWQAHTLLCLKKHFPCHKFFLVVRAKFLKKVLQNFKKKKFALFPGVILIFSFNEIGKQRLHIQIVKKKQEKKHVYILKI